MQTPVVLHLMNTLADSSISRIVERIISFSRDECWQWRVGSLSGYGEMKTVFERLGAQVIDFSSWPVGNYLAEYPVQIVHSHTPRTIFSAWRGLRSLDRSLRPYHLATKHLLTRPGDRRWGAAFALVDRLSLYLPDCLVPVSRTMMSQIVAQPGMARRRVVAIPNGIPCEQFEQTAGRNGVRRELGLAENALVVGYAGRIERVKRLDLLLDAFAQLLPDYPQLRLLILGEGSMKAELQALAIRWGMGQAVVWAGFRADMTHMLAAMDVYVQPSSNEGLSLSILEAMAAGRPVVATTVGAAREVLADGETGLLVPPNSAEMLAAAMRRLLSDSALQQHLATAALQLVNEQYSIGRMAAAYRQLYTRALVERKHG